MFSSVGTCAYELVEKVKRNCVNRRLNFRNKVLPNITFSASFYNLWLRVILVRNTLLKKLVQNFGQQKPFPKNNYL